jgi:hypothetical protein
VYAFYILPHVLFLITHTTFAAGIMDGSWLRPRSPVFTLLFRSPAVDGSSVMFFFSFVRRVSPCPCESPLNVWKQGCQWGPECEDGSGEERSQLLLRLSTGIRSTVSSANLLPFASRCRSLVVPMYGSLLSAGPRPRRPQRDILYQMELGSSSASFSPLFVVSVLPTSALRRHTTPSISFYIILPSSPRLSMPQMSHHPTFCSQKGFLPVLPTSILHLYYLYYLTFVALM